MREKFFIKKFPKFRKALIPTNNENELTVESPVNIEEVTDSKKNKKNKNKEAMDFNDKMTQVEATLASMEPEVKVVKRDKGLIERTESSKIILTEDNRQLLVD